MTRQQLKDTFGDLYVESDISAYDKIITGEKSFIEADVFLDMFGDSDLNYESLADNNSSTDGWRDIFKDWQARGILN